MKSWQYVEQDESGNDRIVTLSEQEILDRYWDYWYNKMCKRSGKEFVDQHFTDQDCIDDWVVINWAWEIKL